MATIYKRGKVWWGRVHRQGRELRQSLKTPAEGVARKRLAAWVAELDRLAWGGKPRYTFDDLALEFIEGHLPQLKPGASRRYLISLEVLADSFEGLELPQITSSRLAEFEARRRQGGRRIPERMRGYKRPQPLSPATIRRDLACLSSMFGYAIELEWIDHNPVAAYLRRARRRGLRESLPRRRYLTSAEEQLLLAAAAVTSDAPDLAAAIALAIDTGLRRGELFGLTRDRVRLDTNEIRLKGDGTKNARPRNVPLLPRARAILAQQPAHLRSPLVLVNPATGRGYIDMRRGLAGAAKRAGIEPLQWHDLRRTCGCRLLQDRGLSMEQVSRWLGHCSVLVTERAYAFLEDEHLQRAITARE
jgi:integrase/recombinase XerD